MASFLLLKRSNLIMSLQLVPSQQKGKSVDLEESVIANDTDASKQLFQDAVHLLRHPATWHPTAGALSATFFH